MLRKIAPGHWIQTDSDRSVKRVRAMSNLVEIDIEGKTETVRCDSDNAALAEADRIAETANAEGIPEAIESEDVSHYVTVFREILLSAIAAAFRIRLHAHWRAR